MVEFASWTLRIIPVKLPSAANSETAAASPTKVLKMLPSIVSSRAVAARFNPEEGTCGLSRINFRLFYFRKVTSRSPWGGTETAKANLRELGYFCKLRRQINRRERDWQSLFWPTLALLRGEATSRMQTNQFVLLCEFFGNSTKRGNDILLLLNLLGSKKGWAAYL